jgi:hypothetical protein
MKHLSLIQKFLLVIIILFSFCLYFYKNTTVPPSLFSDEADLNYQAFVFNSKGTDYFGNKLPIHFHSFSDWRTSFYIYSVALVQKFTGHVDSAARLPAAIFGALSILIFFLILKNLLKNNIWALIGSFIFSITPWLFIYSRAGFEATGMLLFLLLGLYFWIKFINSKKNKFLFFSVLSFATTIYFYSTAKLFLIFLAITMVSLWFKTLIKLPIKTKVILVLIILISVTPFLIDTIKGRAGYRFSYINIFTDPTVSKNVDYLRNEDSIMVYGQKIGLTPSLSSKIFHNKITQWSKTFSKNYFSSFSTEFLFLKGDGNLRQGSQNTGNLFFPSFFLILIGLSSILIKKTPNYKFYYLFLIALFSAPIPFALTRDSVFPHATRLILMLPFLTIFSIFGLKKLFEITKSKYLIVFIIFLYSLCFAKFNHEYYFHYPNISARDWHFGMKEAVLKSINSDYEKIYFSDSYEPFMPFFLNYSEYLPNDKNISPASSFISNNDEFFNGVQAENKYYIGHIEWTLFLNNFNNFPKNVLFVIPERDLIRINNNLNDYNRNKSVSIALKIIDKVDKKYTEQEELYLAIFKYNDEI